MKKSLTAALACIALSQMLVFAPPKKKGGDDCFAGLKGKFASPSTTTSRRTTTPQATTTGTAGAGAGSATTTPPDAEDPTPALVQLRANLDRLTIPNPTTPGIEIKMIDKSVTDLIDKVLRGECFSEEELVGCIGVSCDLAIPYLETIIGDDYWGIGAKKINKPMILIAFLAIYHALSLAVKKANLTAGSKLARTAAIQLRMIELAIEDYKKELREKNPDEAEEIIRTASFGCKEPQHK